MISVANNAVNRKELIMSVNIEIVERLKNIILSANLDNVATTTKEALDNGIETSVIMRDAISAALNELQENQYHDYKVWYTPELFLAYEAARQCLDILKPYIKSNETVGTIVLGTPEGDTHDVGAKWLAISLICAGFKVIYLGRDVSPSLFVNKAIETNAQIIGVSCHQTTGFKKIEEIIDLLVETGLSNKIMLMAGGSVITEKYAKNLKISYTKSAPSAVKLALEHVGVHNA